MVYLDAAAAAEILAVAALMTGLPEHVESLDELPLVVCAADAEAAASLELLEAAAALVL